MKEGSIREFTGHCFTYLSNDNQTIHKYYSYRINDGWTIVYESTSVNGNSELTKVYIPDELYEIFTADKAIEQLSS